MIANALIAACVNAAAQFYGHAPAQLWLIQKVEGGWPGLEMKNRDGSADLGPFQINDRAWVRHLAQKLDRSQATVRAALKYDACFNAYAAGYILRLAIEQSGGDVWEGMGRYHSASPALKAAYQHRLAALYEMPSAIQSEVLTVRRARLQNERIASANGVGEDLIRGHPPMR